MKQQCGRPTELSDFLGSWRVERVITDFLTGAESQFEGMSTWRGDGRAAECVEQGDLFLAGGALLAASRTYHWSARGDVISVAFSDGHPFHELQLSAREWSTEHHCDPDLYRGLYDFSSWPTWRLTWRVTGPRKNYRSITAFNPR